ncbi:MAG: hypothetical protein K6F82_01065 [Sphaerochaetaceae bacterium]|nr:hypothetical protein [Sphaerochaetaceae bacterium]
MKNNYSEKIRVIIGNSDSTLHLSLPSAMTYFMDIATVHAQMLGIGYDIMEKKNLVWITTKTMVDMIKAPSFLREAEVSTWVEGQKNGRSYRDYAITGDDGKLLVCGKTEWTAMDIKKRIPVSAESVVPSDLEEREAVCTQPFKMIDHDFTGCDTCGTYKVRSIDVDFIGHMNNTSYVRAFLGCLSSKELKEKPIKHFEISYVSQCFEGNTIEFKIRRNGNEAEICGFNTDNGNKSAVFIYYTTA